MSKVLKAGRELDALIAEKVMGWTRCNDPAHGPVCHFWFDVEKNGHTEELFSTDIEAAWKIVDRLHGTLFSVRDRFIRGLSEQMTVGDNIISPAWWIWSLTPEIICLAALKAVEKP